MKYNISVIISCYNEEENVPKIYEKLIESINKSKKVKDYEIVFINDNSQDRTKENIINLSKQDKKVKLITFLKRTGKSIGLQVGFENVDKNTDLVFMMDADLQDDPKEINRFIAKIEEGYDLVSGYKKIRLDNLEKKTASKIYNKVLNLVFKMNLHDHNCGFKCFRKEVLRNLKIYDDLHRFITVFVNAKGYSVGEIPVKHHKRIYGKTKYGLTRYFVGFKDMLRVKFILSHQNKKAFLIDTFIWGIILGCLFLVNKVIFGITIMLFVLIYSFLVYNLQHYQKFNISALKKHYQIISRKLS